MVGRTAIALVLATATFVQAGIARAQAVETPPVSQEDPALAAPEKPKKKAAKPQKPDDSEILVTGSLIPAQQTSLPTPVIVITADDLKQRGFNSVSEALQRSSVATGAVTGPASGVTRGATTLSMFGLSVGFTKYLLNGRPMGNYPALYSGASSFVDLSNIPTALVERIEILPGGQSSLYGSDAIAGLVNIKLKDKAGPPTIDVRSGLFDEGGGRSLQVAATAGLTTGKLTALFGAQYNKVNPLWGFQRDLTATLYGPGVTTPYVKPVAEIGNPLGWTTSLPNAQSCDKLAGLFGGSTGYVQEGTDAYCGNRLQGFNTTINKEERIQLYSHLSYDLDDGINFYADLLYGHSKTGNTNWSSVISSDYYYSSTLQQPYYLQKYISPEEAGGLDDILDTQTVDSFNGSFGVAGPLGVGNWKYDLNLVHTRQNLKTTETALTQTGVDAYFDKILGPSLGNFTSRVWGTLPTRNPNLDLFLTPMTPAEYASMLYTGGASAKTSSVWTRGLLTNNNLFDLPGGPAGIALAAEWGVENWNYTPDIAYTNGSLWGGFTDIEGDGQRKNVAAVGELRLPVVKFATLSGSLRYDRYSNPQNAIGDVSYNIALEVFPIDAIKLRARYGTAFKAPTLPDMYLGSSGGLNQGPDRARCQLAGYVAPGYVGCPHLSVLYRTETSGNPDLKAITANVLNVGTSINPFGRLRISLDYLRWRISNQVTQYSATTILQDEALCLNANSTVDPAMCAWVKDLVTRDANGALVEVFTPKYNVSRQNLESIVASLDYVQPIGRFGQLDLSLSYSRTLSNETQALPTSLVIDRQDPRLDRTMIDKVNGSISWSLDTFNLTVYGDVSDNTPNYYQSAFGVSDPRAGLLPTWTRFNVSAGLAVTPRIKLNASVNNVFNKMPPDDAGIPAYETIPYAAAVYDVYGRQFLLQASFTL